MNTIVLTAGGAKPTGDVLTAGGATPPTGGSGGGGGATVTAINKTGATITRGQKVWLNENVQSANTSYQMPSSGANMGCVICRTGTYGYSPYNTYSLTDTTATKQVSITAQYWDKLRYADNGAMFLMRDSNCWRIDEQAQYNISFIPIGGDMFVNNYGGYKRVDITNGTVIESLPQFTNFNYSQVLFVEDSSVCIHNKQRAFYNREENKWVTYSINVDNHNSYLYTIAMTLDNKYMLCSDSTSYTATNSSGCGLRLIERIDADNYRVLLQSEMPEDLQDFYTGSSITFNPYTGILTAAKQKSTNYVVMRYENGTWTKVPVDLSGFLGDTNFFRGPLTVSDDLTRACATYSVGASSSAIYGQIINLVDTSGYAAVPYRFYNVNENTITGYAGNDTEPNMEVIVGIASVPSVDNGGTGGNYDPTTPALEEVPFNDSYIDTNKIVSVGRVFNTDRNEPTAVDLANLTEDSGFTQYSNSLFTSEDKSLADEFFIRFHFSDRVGDGNMKMQFIYLFGHNIASDGGNWWDETDRSDQFAIPLGFDSEWNYKTFGVNTGFVTEDGYHCPNTRVDIGNDLQFGWNTVKMYFNNDIQMWCLAFGDNFSMEYSIPELPKVCKPYNLISLVDVAGYGDNCVDLAETGFKLNGEWVWRAVK